MAKLVIDNFNSTTSSTVIVQGSQPGPQSWVDNGGTGVLGQYRSITLAFLAGEANALVNFGVTGAGQGSFNFGPKASFAQVALLYDANGRGLQSDFSQYTKVFIDIATLDVDAMPIIVTLYSGGKTFTMQQTVAAKTSTQTVMFPFSSFSPQPNATALAAVAAVQVCCVGHTDQDLGIDNIGVTS